MFNFIKGELPYFKVQQAQDERQDVRETSESGGSSKHSYINTDDSGSGWGLVL